MNDLREQIAGIIKDGLVSDLDLADRIINLFPPQLTESEVENILPKKKEVIFPEDFKCGGCGLCSGCLHYAQSGELEENIKNNIYNQAIDDCKSALIGKCGLSEGGIKLLKKCKAAIDEAVFTEDGLDGEDGANLIKEIDNFIATPTFSGEKCKIPNCECEGKAILEIKEKHQSHCKFPLHDCSCIPTEQKKYCKCPPVKGVISAFCDICGKPIPAEKKEETPKPKERIEGFEDLENVIDKELLKVATPLELSSEEVTTLAKVLTKAVTKVIIQAFNSAEKKSKNTKVRT